MSGPPSGGRARLLQIACGLSLFGSIFLLSNSSKGQQVGQNAMHHLAQYTKPSYESSSSSDPPLLKDKYSIVVSTYARVEHLEAFLDHYGHAWMPNLDAIHIAWGMGAVDPPESIKLNSYKIPVYLERASRNSLTERFRKPKNMRTEAAIWLDDDILVDAKGVEFGFRAYKQHGSREHRITGISARHYEHKKGQLNYIFYQDNYSIVLTNDAFLDMTMLEWFWEDDPRTKAAIEYVDEHMNCEDILMNFIVSAKNGLPPVLLDLTREKKTVDSVGISQKTGHMAQRGLCMERFIELYGMTLKTSDLAISRSQREFKSTMPLPKKYKPEGQAWAAGKSFTPL